MRWYQHNQTDGLESKDLVLQSGIQLNLWSCSFHDTFCYKTTVERPFFSLGYVLEGTASCLINNSNMDFQPDFPHIQFLGNVNSCTEYKPGDRFKYLHIAMTPDMFRQYWQSVGGAANYSFDSFLNNQQYLIQHSRINYREKMALYELARIFENKEQNENYLALESRCLYLLSENLCRLNGKEIMSPDKSCSYESKRIALARDVILSRLESPPSLLELSRIVGLNDCSLKRGFKLKYGCTVYSFVRQQRLEKAYMLISKDGYNVSQSAFAVGYTNLSHFSKIFYEAFNLFPCELVKIRKSFYN